MNNLQSLTQTLSEINSGKTTCSQHVRACLDNIVKFNKQYNALVSVAEESKILQLALGADLRRANNESLSLLDGLTVVIKDNICTKDLPTTCASRILQNYESPYDATIVKKLKKLGVIILGKANLDEFAMGSTTSNSVFGTTANGTSPDLCTGGSSGGCAAAVSLGMCDFAIGSDTGGSVRQPAAFNNLFGLKPTYGVLSRYGLVSYASSLDTIGIITSELQDLELIFNLLAEYDNLDSTSVKKTTSDSVTIKPKIAVINQLVDCLSDNFKNLFNEFIKKIKNQADVTFYDVLELEYAIPCYYITACSEAASNLGRYDGIRFNQKEFISSDFNENIADFRQGFSPEVKKRILLGNFSLSQEFYNKYYAKCQNIRQTISFTMKKILNENDVILSVTTPDKPPRINEDIDSLSLYKNDITTVIPNLTGLPALSVPLAPKEYMSLQIMANSLFENKIFSIAKKII